jgi:hypothetical protein
MLERGYVNKAKGQKEMLYFGRDIELIYIRMSESDHG